MLAASAVREAFQRHSDQPFSVCTERSTSYAELDSFPEALGAWLQPCGLEACVRVAITLPNIPQFAVTMCAVPRAGYACVDVNPLYTARELAHQLTDSGATSIVILENFASTLAQVIDETPNQHVVLTSMGDLLCGPYGTWITLAVRHLAHDAGSQTAAWRGTPFHSQLPRDAGLNWARMRACWITSAP